MNFYCDVSRQKFVWNFRSPALADIILTQNNDVAGKFYLVQPNGNSPRYPFMFDPASGDSTMTAVVTLCFPGGNPLTLTTPVTLTAIANGFAGTIRTNTNEIVTFLAGYSQRRCALAIEVTDQKGNHVTSFQSEVTLRMASTAAGTVEIPGVVRLTAITGYTGGGPTNLDGIVTDGLSLGTLFWVKINGAESHWELSAGSTPSDPDSGIILTTDGGQLLRTIGV